jgi:ankyrin repeat protein
MPQPHPAPPRTLPARPSLAQLRKQAKELLQSYRAGEPAAVTEVERFERSPDPARFALADAQRVLARAYGFPSWTALKQHVEGVTVQAFCKAAEAGDVVRVRKLARERPELVNTERGGEFGERIALHFAVLNHDAAMTRALMELGSDARKGLWPHRSATTAHTLARERGYDEIVALIEREEERRRQAMSAPGATVSAKTDEIHQAIREDRCEAAIRLLESDRSLVGACSIGGETPLHVAARAHNPEMVAWLFDHGAAVDAEAPFEVPPGTPRSKIPGKTPLDYAAIVAGWSAHGRDFSLMENSRKDPARFHETVRLLRARRARLTPRAAVAIGDPQAVRQLHREGRLDNEIHWLRGGLLSIAVRVNRPEMVALLLDLGLDPDETIMAEDGTRMSWGMPLWFAAMGGRHEIAELLIARGADVNAVVFASGDAWCTADRTGDETMKALLLAHGARLTVEHVPDRATAKAILAGTIPAQSLNVSEPSLTDLAEQMLWAAGSRDPEIVRMCLPHMTRKRDDPWWNYVLMHATLPDSFKLILEHGVDPDVAGGEGYTILHHLATDHVPEPTRVIRATLLLDAGASLYRRDPLLRSTPLGWACRWGRVDLVQLYLARGMDPREPDAEPWATPAAWATKRGHQDIIELLRLHGAR